MAATDSQREAEEREPAAGDLGEIRQVLVVGDAGCAAEQVHGVDAVGGVVRARRVDAEDLRLAAAQPVGRALVEPRVLGRVLGRAAEAVDGARAQQRTSPSRRSTPTGRSLEVIGGDVLARLDAGDVQARALAAELREVHAVDRRRVRARVEMAQRVDVRRPVVAERDAEALVGEVAVEVRRRVLEAVVLPDLGLKVSSVHGHALINLLRQIYDPCQDVSSRDGATYISIHPARRKSSAAHIDLHPWPR